MIRTVVLVFWTTMSGPGFPYEPHTNRFENMPSCEYAADWYRRQKHLDWRLNQRFVEQIRCIEMVVPE